MSEKSPRAKWFISMIGKTMYRNKGTCDCNVCQTVYKEGLILDNEHHALYVCDVEAESNCEGLPLKYFDTIKERDEFELTIKKNENKN